MRIREWPLWCPSLIRRCFNIGVADKKNWNKFKFNGHTCQRQTKLAVPITNLLLVLCEPAPLRSQQLGDLGERQRGVVRTHLVPSVIQEAHVTRQGLLRRIHIARLLPSFTLWPATLLLLQKKHHLVCIWAIQVLRNAFFLEIWHPPPPRNATVHLRNAVFLGKSNSSHWPHSRCSPYLKNTYVNDVWRHWRGSPNMYSISIAFVCQWWWNVVNSCKCREWYANCNTNAG